MRFLLSLSIATLCLTGCFVAVGNETEPTRNAVTIASITPDLTVQVSPTPNNFPAGVYDALATAMGICFEASWDAADTIFIIRSAEEHIRFYDLADNSELCRRAVGRVPFEFGGGDILLGTWTRGLGCTAQHTITNYVRDDNTKTITIQAEFSTEGDCPYELVRGFWLGIEDAQDYTIQLDVD
ncbi:MAG: hypothetical protein Phog2KO_43920 [Phototrophicaceae bacterium]